MTTGKLQAIWIKRMKLGPMDPADVAELAAGRGIVGNADQGSKRQVTLLEEEAWGQLMEQFGAALPTAARRANLVLRDIRLFQTRGQVLRIGPCRIRILGETKPCERMDQALPGLQDAMRPDWNGGAFGEVLNTGNIAVGDVVCWEEDRSVQEA